MRVFFTNIALLMLVLLLGNGQQLMAQKKVQVVTKTISQKLDQKLDSGIVVEGKKASVSVTGWEKDYTLVEIDLISKHANVDVALSELEYIQYVISKTDTHYKLKNSFFSKSGKTRIKSSLSVAYRIFVPMNTKVQVADQYGEVKLVNLFGQVSLDVEFCEVNFERLFGSLQVKSEYGEFIGKDFDATFDMKSKKTEISLTGFAGKVSLDNNYGDISLKPSAMLQSLEVESRHGKVDLEVNTMDAFNYSVEVNSSYIDLPNTESAFVKGDASGSNYRFERKNGIAKANIRIANLMYPVKIYAYNITGR